MNDLSRSSKAHYQYISGRKVTLSQAILTTTKNTATSITPSNNNGPDTKYCDSDTGNTFRFNPDHCQHIIIMS